MNDDVRIGKHCGPSKPVGNITISKMYSEKCICFLVSLLILDEIGISAITLKWSCEDFYHKKLIFISFEYLHLSGNLENFLSFL